MRTILLLALVLASVVGSFGGGYVLGQARIERAIARELENQALQGLIRALSTDYYADTNDMTQLVNTNDVAIHALLRQLDENKSRDSSPEWMRAKVKTLNAIALQWTKRPPFQGASWLTHSQQWTEPRRQIWPF